MFGSYTYVMPVLNLAGILSTVGTDALMLKHQALGAHNTD